MFVDHATKFSWVYGMKTRDEYIEKLRHLVDVELHSHGVKLKHYHADGDAELISKQVLTLLKREGSRYTWNPADTPELNATSERKFRTLGERCLSIACCCAPDCLLISGMTLMRHQIMLLCDCQRRQHTDT